MKGKMVTPFKKKNEMRRERRNRNRVPDNIIIAIHKDTGEHRIETVGFNTQKKGWEWPWVRKSHKVTGKIEP